MTKNDMPDQSDPFDIPLEMAEEKKSRPLKKILLIAVILACACLWFFSAEFQDTPMNLKNVAKPHAELASRINIANTPAYTEKIEAYAQNKAKTAQKNGQSFVSPISEPHVYPHERVPHEGIAPQIGREKKEESGPVPRETPRREEKKEIQARKEKPRHVRDVQAMAAAMRSSFSHSAPAPQALLLLNHPREKKVSVVQEEKKPPSLRPELTGRMFYCVTRLSLDSDSPGPCIAEVVEGRFQGSRFIGTFARFESRLVLRFTSFHIKDGETVSVEAYGVDPATDRTSLATSVDHHYLERFGGIIAASFLEGFGEAVQSSGKSSYSSLYGASTIVPHYNLQEQLTIAAGRAGNRAASLMSQNFSRAPTVHLRSGTDLGVLITKVEEKSRYTAE